MEQQTTAIQSINERTFPPLLLRRSSHVDESAPSRKVQKFKVVSSTNTDEGPEFSHPPSGFSGKTSVDTKCAVNISSPWQCPRSLLYLLFLLRSTIWRSALDECGDYQIFMMSADSTGHRLKFISFWKRISRHVLVIFPPSIAQTATSQSASEQRRRQRFVLTSTPSQQTIWHWTFIHSAASREKSARNLNLKSAFERRVWSELKGKGA